MKKIYCALFLVMNFCGFAQTYNYNDAQLWFNLYLEKQISHKFLVHLNQQDRWSNNVTRFNLGYADIGVTYKLTKNIKILADYVFTQKRRYVLPESAGPLFSIVHQFYVAMTFKKDIGRWRFMYRNMYQVQYTNPYTSAKGYIPQVYDRNKFIVKYELTKRYTPYIAQELYIPLNSPITRGIDRSRTFAGIFYRTFRHQQLELYFMYQNRLQNTSWYKQKNTYSYYNYILKQFFVYGIGYSFEF